MASRALFLLRGNKLILGVATLLGTSFGTKKIYDELAQKGAENASAHPDKSKARIAVQPQVERKITVIVDESAEGKRKHIIIGQKAYSEIVHKQIESIEALRSSLRKNSADSITTQLEPVFGDVSSRADRFANWYFAYSTTFKLLREATTSAGRHALRSGKLSDGIAHDLETFLEKKYERIVLQPEITDPQLRQAFGTAVRSVHGSFVVGVSKMQQDLLDQLQKNTSHVQPLEDTGVELSLDWASQLYKIKAIPAQYEKMPELTIALSAGGALFGKAAGAAGGKLATNAFLSKIAAPFVTKVLGPTTGAAIGSFAGPLGAVTGVVVGIGIDFGLNKGVELVQREAFVNDLKHVIDTTQKDYEHRMQGELLRVIDVWIDDSIQLLLLQKSNNNT